MSIKLYYHKTDGGAEYLCTSHVKGTTEGLMTTAVVRLDGRPEALFDFGRSAARIAELEKALESIEYQGRVFGKDNITADLCGKLAREALLKKG